MPWDALPERLQDPNNWKGTDDDVWYMRWRLYCKGWFAYGPRAKEWWACWKVPPKEIFKIGSNDGNWRYEIDPWTNEPYLSRIQYWKRWHLALRKPFLITFHFYFKKADVPNPPDYPGDTVNNKLFYLYFGTHYDQDCVYWFPSLFIGLTWK